MGVYRFVFNWTVSRKHESYTSSGKSESYMKHRKEWISFLRDQFPWVADAPAHTVYGAMMCAEKAYKLVVGKRAKGSCSDLPRCRKKTQRSFFILGNAVTQKGVYPQKLGILKAAEPLPNKPCDSRIVYECGKWYLQVPYNVNVQHSENQGRVCAIDPGVRTFATVFSQVGIHKIGDGLFGRIVRLSVHLDDLLSRASKAPARRKKSMYRAAARMRRKIRRLVTDMHYQTLGWLFRNFDTVVFPISDFTSACNKARRKIGRISVRALLTWSFAKMRERLVHKAQCLGKNVLIVNEAYTSKTANWTGEIVRNMGGRKRITSQDVSIDRDVNGALGIFLKALVDHPVACYRNC